MRKTLCAAALVLAVLGLGAEEAKESLSGIVEVRAPAWSPLAAAPGAPVTVIGTEEIEASGASTLAELLSGRSGVFVQRSGGGAGVASASVRGSTANQVLVVVDGLRLNDSRQGGADLGQLSTASIERVEILSSGASAIYGPDALGGAIVITTKRAKESRLSAELTNVSYPGALGEGGASALADTQRLALDAGLVLGSADLALAATAERGLAAYPYGGTELRKNSAFSGGSARLSLSAPLAGGRFGAVISGALRGADVAGSLIFPADAEQRDDSLRGSLSFSHDGLAGGLLSLDAQASGSWTRLEYEDPAYGTDDRHDMATGGLDLRASLLATESLELGAGFSGLYEGADSTAFAASAGGQPSRLSLGGYLAPKYLVGEHLVLAPVARFDWADDYSAGFSLMASLRWKASEALELRASGGTSYRAPTFNELYWPFEDFGAWGSYEGNPDLKPETSLSGDLGAALAIGALELSASGFARYVDDLIVTSSDFASKPVNLNKAFVPGASAKAALALAGFEVAADYEFLYPLDLSGGAELADAARIESLPVHRADFTASYETGAFEGRLAIRYASEKTISAKTIPGAAILDLGASCEIGERLRLGLKAENLLDTSYEVISGYPMPGRSLTTSLKFEL